MRKLFATLLLEEMKVNSKVNLITADMGYGLWDTIRDTFPDRFFNVGSAEQLMVGCAAGMALEGKIPVCYSITPFILYRPFEFIRNFMNIEKIPVKLVGGGRDKDYGYLGFTHWADDDVPIMSAFKNIVILKPESEDILKDCFGLFINNNYPTYINLVK